MSTIENVAILEAAKVLVSQKAKAKGIDLQNEGVQKELAKSLMAKSSLLAFDDDDDSLVLTRTEAVEVIQNEIANFEAEIEAKAELEKAGASAKTLITKWAMAIHSGASEKADGLAEIEKVITDQAYSEKLLDQAIAKEEAKEAFLSTKASRFVRVAKQLLAGSDTDEQKMNAVLNLVRARFTEDENKAMVDALKAEATANIGATITVSKEDGTEYTGKIFGIGEAKSAVSYKIKTNAGVQYIGVAQRLSYEITAPAEATEGDEEKED